MGMRGSKVTAEKTQQLTSICSESKRTWVYLKKQKDKHGKLNSLSLKDLSSWLLFMVSL